MLKEGLVFNTHINKIINIRIMLAENLDNRAGAKINHKKMAISIGFWWKSRRVEEEGLI